MASNRTLDLLHSMSNSLSRGHSSLKAKQYSGPPEFERLEARRMLSVDFNGNGIVDLDDLNALTLVGDLVAGVAVPPAEAKFDLTGDNLVNTADLDKWLADAATINGFGSPYLKGDTDLDGDVDNADLGMAAGSFTGSGGTGRLWSQGDFDGDGDVDNADIGIATGNFTGAGVITLPGDFDITGPSTAVADTTPTITWDASTSVTNNGLEFSISAVDVVISEFLASNSGGLKDGDGDSSDWIELYNGGSTAVDLGGYYLTDDSTDLTKWAFPAGTSLDAGSMLLVFASDKGSEGPIGELHTTFKLSSDGEYLGLIQPDGQTVVHDYSPEFPSQVVNVSYGLSMISNAPTTHVDDLSSMSYWVPTSGNFDSTWADIAFDDSGWSVGAPGIGYENNTGFESLINTPVPSGTTTAYTRFTFNLADVSHISTLSLEMIYDDGFVAYLNGEEVESENAPANPNYQSNADGGIQRSDDVVLDGYVQFDISAFADSLVVGENVLAIHALNRSSSSDMLMIPRLVSAGTQFVEPIEEGFFPEPTPGAPNSESLLGIVADMTFSHDRGYYDSSFDVTITTDTPGAVIRYTLDRSTPSESSGLIYTGPVHVSSTTALRAIAYKTEFWSTNVDTQTYIFISDVMNQPGMSSHIKNDPTWGPLLDDALLALPTVSIVSESDVLTDTVYKENVHEVEMAASFEMFYPDGSRDFQINAGAEFYGNYALRDFSKKSLRLSFKGIYGESKLRYDVFDDGGVDVFDNLLLQAGGHDSLFFKQGTQEWPGNPGPAVAEGTYVRGRWFADRQLEMGQPAPRGRFVNVYFNGEYWGQYNLMERPNAAFMAENFGGDKEDYDALNKGIAIDGDLNAFNAMKSVAASGTYEELQQYLDVENYADYMLAQFYGGNTWDWYPNANWMGARERTPGAGFVFFAWDSDMAIRRAITSNSINNGGPGGMWANISGRFPEFREMMADRAQKYFFNGGMFTPDRVNNDFLALKSEIELSMVAETARWGVESELTSTYDPDDWTTQFQLLENNFFPGRTDIVIDQLKTANILPDIDAPTYSIDGVAQHGGDVIVGDSLTMQAEAEAVIKYTLDGSDPKDPGALTYSTSIHLYESTLVKSRAFDGNEWSALSEALFTTESPLRVTEIMYNPEGSSDDAEFIELKNTSGVAIPIAGVRFDGSVEGIEFTFDPAEPVLGPGEHIVVVRNQIAFAGIYNTAGMRIALGEYDGSDTKLSNGGEQITLVDSAGGLIQQFTYNDTWYPTTDGDGFSLVIIDAAGPVESWDTAAAWQPSSQIGGSPGGDADLDGFVDAADFIALKQSFGMVSGATWGNGDADGDGDVDWYDLQSLIASFGTSVGATPAEAPADVVAEPELVAASVSEVPDADALAIAASALGNRFAAGHHDLPILAAKPANSLLPVNAPGRVGLLSTSISPLLSLSRTGQEVADVLTLAESWWSSDSARHELPEERWMTSLDTDIADKSRKGQLDLPGLDVLAGSK